MLTFKNLPPQQLAFSKKTKEWRMAHLEWADKRTFFYDNTVRKSILRKRINYNLLNGILNMEDVALVLNPDQVQASYVPDQIQHYSILNSKLKVLQGEELERRYNFRAIVTNPTAITEIENNKKEALFQHLQQMVENLNLSEEEMQKEIEKVQYYYNYEWQDLREQRANYLLNHYMKELSVPLKFNLGFMDAMVVGEEIYQCDIVGGEPTFEKINPMKLHVFRNGYSSRIEDADMIVYIDYWAPGRIIDTFYDTLTTKDMDYIENLPHTETTEMYNVNETDGFVNMADVDTSENGAGAVIDNFILFGQSTSGIGTNYFDNNGNIRVLRVYWKSRRKIRKVKSYNQETGEEEFNFYPESYRLDTTVGEEEQVFWINEAWEGTKIGQKIYINMRPKLVQYNRLSNPSRCHFGFVGSIYNLNDSKPFSLVDHMKPFAYLYDVIHDRLNKAIAANWGKIVKLDLAMVPKGWAIEKWLHYAKINHIAVTDSFKEGNKGSATGKLAGMMNNQSSGVIDAETGNYIQQHVNLLELIKMEMAEAVGISKQREGQISNRETVGGVERSNLQSSHITRPLFAVHDDVKKRALECLLETAKIAMKGGSKKFQYILSDNTSAIVDIDGDEFAEADYGIVVDGSPETSNLEGSLREIAHAAIQAGNMQFSSILKVLTTPSMAEIQRIIEKDEQLMQERQAQASQAEYEAKQRIEEIKIQSEQSKLQIEYDRLTVESENNIRDNETKLLIANISGADEEVNDGVENIDPVKKAELVEKIRQFDETLAFQREKLGVDTAVKLKQIASKPKTTNTGK